MIYKLGNLDLHERVDIVYRYAIYFHFSGEKKLDFPYYKYEYNFKPCVKNYIMEKKVAILKENKTDKSSGTRKSRWDGV